MVQNFGMLDLVKKVLASHKCQMDRSREQYARDLAGTTPGSRQCRFFLCKKVGFVLNLNQRWWDRLLLLLVSPRSLGSCSRG